MKKNFLLVALLAGSLGVNSFAATKIYVKAGSGNDNYNGSSWNTAFKTVSKAIGSVQDNEETIIYLEPNTVFDTGGQLDLGENKNVTIIGNNTTLRAAEKPGKEGGEGARILRAVAGCDLTVKGITFLNGRQVAYAPGGGLFFAGNTLVVDSCIFIDNESDAGGAAIASRGKDVTVRNSYFDGNYIFEGSGYATGAAILQAGVKDVDGSSLRVENCTFYSNDVNNGVGSAISTEDAAASYSNVGEITIVNCTFLANTSKLPNQADVDVTNSDGALMKIINNTFYGNDGALRIGDIYTGELYFINNLVYATGSGIFGDPNYTVNNYRTPIEGYNNIIIGGERGVNEAIDDECFNGKKDQYNNRVETTATYPLSMVALATSLSTDNYVPYLPLTAENSDAVNAGYSDGAYADMIPATDIRGLKAVGTRDIGAYEYGATEQSAIASVVADESDFVIARNGDQITVVNKADRHFTLTVVDMLGRTVYSAEGTDMLTVNKQDIATRCAIFVLTDGVSKKVEKVML